MGETTKNRSVLPYYGVAATWVVFSLLRDLYSLGHFLFVGVLSAGVFLLLRAVCKNEEAPVVKPAAPEPKKVEEPASTGNAELGKMVKDGRLAIAEMKRLNESIEDPALSAQIDRLEAVTGQIFAQVQAEPAKLPQIRRFMDYYLPTTLKLLNAYDRMGSTGVSGENIDSTMGRVEKMMGTIVAAFEKQLDSLFGSEALDISTDIAVLETMMAREGLAGERLEAETTKDASGGDIELGL